MCQGSSKVTGSRTQGGQRQQHRTLLETRNRQTKYQQCITFRLNITDKVKICKQTGLKQAPPPPTTPQPLPPSVNPGAVRSNISIL